MIARILAIQTKIAEQMRDSPGTISTKEANNQRALYSQLHFSEFLSQADELIRENPTIETKCGQADSCNRRGQTARFLEEAGIDPTLAEFNGQGGYRKKRRQTKKVRQIPKKKTKKTKNQRR